MLCALDPGSLAHMDDWMTAFDLLIRQPLHKLLSPVEELPGGRGSRPSTPQAETVLLLVDGIDEAEGSTVFGNEVGWGGREAVQGVVREGLHGVVHGVMWEVAAWCGAGGGGYEGLTVLVNEVACRGGGGGACCGAGGGTGCGVVQEGVQGVMCVWVGVIVLGNDMGSRGGR